MCSTHPHDHSGGALAGLLPKLGWPRWGAVAAAEGSQSLSGAASRPSRIKTCNGLENLMDGACAACGTASGHVAYAQTRNPSTSSSGESPASRVLSGLQGPPWSSVQPRAGSCLYRCKQIRHMPWTQCLAGACGRIGLPGNVYCAKFIACFGVTSAVSLNDYSNTML